MKKYKENDKVEWKGLEGVIQYIGCIDMYVFFSKLGKIEIFNLDGSKKEKTCLKVEEPTVTKNSMNSKGLGKLLTSLKGRILH